MTRTMMPAKPGSAPAAWRAARRMVLGLVDTIVPPQCGLCATTTTRHGDLCAACWQQIRFIGRPYCNLCGTPFAFDPGAEMSCAACLARPPSYRRARAVMHYDDFSRDLIMAFKSADRTDLAGALGRWLLRAGGTQVAEADLIVPVPLHWRRLAKRRYNQSALLAHGLARRSGRGFVPDLLVRTRNTPSQGVHGAAGRWRNVRGAFAVSARRRARLDGKVVLLIDDVMTTGATVEACAQTLRRAGARAVDVLTLARVVRPRGDII